VKKLSSGLTVVSVLALAACAYLDPSQQAKVETLTTFFAKPAINPVVNNCNITPPNILVTPALLDSGLPCDVTAIAPFTLPNLQQAFDYYSWLSFLALNAPANGKPIGSGQQPGGDGPAQWEQWKEISDFILPGGAQPGPWESRRAIPQACRAIGGSDGMKVVRMVGKTPTLLSDIVQPFDTGPLIDQNGRYVRYEILVNKPMYEYILQNNLYSKRGQAAFTSTVVFPSGAVTKGTTGTVGAIMAKAAWKVMEPGADDLTRFHTVDALVYQPPLDSPKVAESCHTAKLGLVGLHVGHKTNSSPQWIWSTFEHTDNMPTQVDVQNQKLQAHYNFYKPGCNTGACPVNTPPQRPWNPDVEPFPGSFTSQIVRVTPLTSDVLALNKSFQGILTKTVWQNYMQISTQWPTDPASKTDPNGVPAPAFLANGTLETYIQGKVPQSSSSCIACHGNAVATSGRTSDFTYILERAQ
jgi:hypothetical protein